MQEGIVFYENTLVKKKKKENTNWYERTIIEQKSLEELLNYYLLKILLVYIWLTIAVSFMKLSYTYVYIFWDSLPIRVIAEYWVEFPVLFSRCVHAWSVFLSYLILCDPIFYNFPCS